MFLVYEEVNHSCFHYCFLFFTFPLTKEYIYIFLKTGIPNTVLYARNDIRFSSSLTVQRGGNLHTKHGEAQL